MPKSIRIILVTIVPIALLGLGAQVHAQATDVDCSGCVDTSDIASQAVTPNKIKPKAVTTSKIAPKAVTNGKIGHQAVSKDKIRPDAIVTGKIKDGAVTVAKVAPELSNAISTFCVPEEVVVGMDINGNFVCETIGSDVAPPPAATVTVDCDAGDRITDALSEPAVELTIEISGMCTEDVEITRTDVTLRGSDPTMDGIMSDPAGLMQQALTVRNTSRVNVENLKLTGAGNGIGINDSFGVGLNNCNLVDNEFAGAIVGTGSAVTFTDTDVAAPNPPTDARLSRGIWATNGSRVSCFDCTVTGYRDALMVSVGSSLFVNGGSFTGGTQESLDVFDNSSVQMANAMIDGRVSVRTKSVVHLTNTVQSNTSLFNRSRTGSSLVAENSTVLLGDAQVGEFANIAILDSSSVSGHLGCFEGGDAFCSDPVAQTGSSDWWAVP